MPSWPGTLPPSPLLGSLVVEQASGPAASALGVGQATLRRRTSSVGERMSMAFGMSSAQRETFQTFYDTTLSNGTANFTMRHPISEEIQTFVFTAPPSTATMTEAFHRVSVRLYREP